MVVVVDVVVVVVVVCSVVVVGGTVVVVGGTVVVASTVVVVASVVVVGGTVVVVVCSVVVVTGTVVVVVVVVGVDAPYDHTYPSPGLPFCQLMQSAHVGRRPAWKSASGWSICHVPLPLLHVHVIVDACAGVVSARTAAGAKISQRRRRPTMSYPHPTSIVPRRLGTALVLPSGMLIRSTSMMRMVLVR